LTRLRVIATRPKSLNCSTFDGARSTFSSSSRAWAITRLRLLALVHVDEVDDDDAAEVAQANLADDLGDGVEVGLDDGVFEARRLADVLAGVDVDGDQRFGLVDDDGAAGLEPDLGRRALLISSVMPNCSKSGVSLV
jgi:hypothetical protein